MLNKKLTKKRSQLGGNQERKRETELNKLKKKILESLEKKKGDIFDEESIVKKKEEKRKNIYDKNASKLCSSTSEYYPDCEDRKIKYLKNDIQICNYNTKKKKCSKVDYTTVLKNKKQIQSVHYSKLQNLNKQIKQAQILEGHRIKFGNDPLTKIQKEQQDKENQKQQELNNNKQRTQKLIKNIQRQRKEAQKKQNQYKALQNARTQKIKNRNKRLKKRRKRRNTAEAKAEAEEQVQRTKKVKITCKTKNDCIDNFQCLKINTQNTDGTCIQTKEISENTTEAEINSTSEETLGNIAPTSNTTPKLNTEQKEAQKEKFKKIIMGNESFNSIEFTDEEKEQFEKILDEIFKDENTITKINTKYKSTYNTSDINKKIVNTLNQIDGTMICPIDDVKDTSFDNIFSNISYILNYNFSDKNNIKTLKDTVKEYYLTDVKFKEEYDKLNQETEPKNFDEYIYFILNEHLIYLIYKPDTLKVDKSRKKSFESNNTKGKKYTKDYYKILIDTIKGIILEFMINYNKK